LTHSDAEPNYKLRLIKTVEDTDNKRQSQQYTLYFCALEWLPYLFRKTGPQRGCSFSQDHERNY